MCVMPEVTCKLAGRRGEIADGPPLEPYVALAPTFSEVLHALSTARQAPSKPQSGCAPWLLPENLFGLMAF